jgi:hypothetical protein
MTDVESSTHRQGGGIATRQCEMIGDVHKRRKQSIAMS